MPMAHAGSLVLLVGRGKGRGSARGTARVRRAALAARQRALRGGLLPFTSCSFTLTLAIAIVVTFLHSKHTHTTCHGPGF